MAFEQLMTVKRGCIQGLHRLVFWQLWTALVLVRWITNQSVAKTAMKSITGHLWYLSETSIGFAFFDSRVSDEVSGNGDSHEAKQ